MIWVGLACLAVLALAPLAWSLRSAGVSRSRRSAALDLHRAQLAELDRDLEQGRIGAPEHAVAKLEVQRRLLAEAVGDEMEAVRSSPLPLLATLIGVPVAGVLLYLPGSAPHLPAAPLAGRIAEARAQAAEADGLIGELRARIAGLDQHSDQAREGFMLLGNLEDTRGDLTAAANAWAQALAIRFDATLAAEVAEARSRIEGKVSPASAKLFRAALAGAPADAPWRAVAERRLVGVPAP